MISTPKEDILSCKKFDLSLEVYKLRLNWKAKKNGKVGGIWVSWDIDSLSKTLKLKDSFGSREGLKL